MPIYALGDQEPTLPEVGHFWVAPDAHVIGRVVLAEDVGVWFGAVIRGDNEPIEIGARTNIQEGAMLHSDPGSPLIIGANVTVGHHAILHGCTVGNNALIGMGSHAAQQGKDRRELHYRRQCACDRGQRVSRLFADRRCAGEGGADPGPRYSREATGLGHALCCQLAPLRGRVAADRLIVGAADMPLTEVTPQKQLAWVGSRPIRAIALSPILRPNKRQSPSPAKARRRGHTRR
jgi:NDP-sugar pyrophosphorylase family protein